MRTSLVVGAFLVVLLVAGCNTNSAPLPGPAGPEGATGQTGQTPDDRLPASPRTAQTRDQTGKASRREIKKTGEVISLRLQLREQNHVIEPQTDGVPCYLTCANLVFSRRQGLSIK